MARPVGMEWDTSELEKSFGLLERDVDRALTATIGYMSPQVEAHARRTAPWTDRTSNARNGLFAKPERDKPVYRIVLGHGVPYGLWLEVRFSGRYAVINPTIQHMSPRVMKNLHGLFRRLRSGK